MRIAWRTVGQICGRVLADAERTAGDRLEGLRRLRRTAAPGAAVRSRAGAGPDRCSFEGRAQDWATTWADMRENRERGASCRLL
jgi:hypothetical protein